MTKKLSYSPLESGTSRVITVILHKLSVWAVFPVLRAALRILSINCYSVVSEWRGVVAEEVQSHSFLCGP